MQKGSLLMTFKIQSEKDADRFEAIEQARWITGGDYCVLDTETTGLINAEMCQIAILHSDGTEFKSLIKPTVKIEPGAEAGERRGGSVGDAVGERKEEASNGDDGVLAGPRPMTTRSKQAGKKN